MRASSRSAAWRNSAAARTLSLRLEAAIAACERYSPASARVRDLLGEPQWDGHDALEFVASIEETLR